MRPTRIKFVENVAYSGGRLEIPRRIFEPRRKDGGGKKTV
jgi:hypothetical protein